MNAIITKLDQTKHKNIMLNILLKISKDPVLARNLVFKGGTAFYFLYDLPRFSTDLDFDLVDSKYENDILEKIGKIMEEFGEVKDLRIKKHTIFGFLSYGDIDHNVKIEINRRGLTGDYSSRNLMGIKINVMNLEDMCANKFIVLTSRNSLANRDIYDIHFILTKGFKINQDIVERLTGKNFEEYIKYMISFLEKLPNKHSILTGLGEVLDEKQKAFVKNSLLTETIFLLHSLI